MIEQEELLLNPFPGLRPFRLAENFVFFGRDGQSDQVLTKLRTARFVAVVGTSGSGKSSLVAAGLLPALFSGHMPSAGSSWRIASFRPGSTPIKNLAAALCAPEVCGVPDAEGAAERLDNIERTLRRSSLGLLEVFNQSKMAPGENLLILADQFEELFRFRKQSTDEHPDDEAAAFVKLLLEAKQANKSDDEKLPIYVILTMRSDYLGDCAHFWGLPEAINEGQFLIPRMTDDNRREAITGPIIIGGGEITAPLVNRLLNDAGDDPAQLPILQHALMRTWDHWKNRCNASGAIDISHYEAIGGMTEALSKHADEAFVILSRGLRVIAAKVFKSLTEKEADSREGRRPATIGEIAAAAEANEFAVVEVVESFRAEGCSFLMPSPPAPLNSDTPVDISHESLIRGWARLREWVDEEADAARQYVRLADKAAHFPDEEGYLSDPALSNGLKWLEDNKPTRAWALRYHPGFDKTIEYLQQSKAFRQAELEEEARKHREEVERDLLHAQALAAGEKKRVKLRNWGLVVLSILMIAMMGITAYALRQQRNAEQQKSRAETLLKDVEVQRDAATRAQKDAEEQRGRAEGALKTAEEQRGKAEEQRENAEKQTEIAKTATIEADRQKKAAVQALGTAKTEATNARKAQSAAQEARILAEQENQRATALLKTVKEIDLSPAYAKQAMRGQDSALRSISLNPAGDFLVTAGADSRAWLWDTKNGLAALAYNHVDPVTSAVFNHKGDLVATAGDGRIGLWSVSGVETRKFDSPGNTYSSVVFSPDDKWIAAIVNGKETSKRNHATGDIRPPDTSYDLSFVELRSVSGDKLLKLSEHTGTINTVAFSHDGKHLVTSSDDHTARIWDTTTGKSIVLSIHSSGVNSVEFSHDDKLIVTAGDDGTAHVWNAENGEILVKRSLGPDDERVIQRSTLSHNGPVTSAHFSDDGKYIATTSGNKAYLWSADLSEQWTNTAALSPTVLAEHEGPVTDAVFSPNGQWVITISQDRTARVWRTKLMNNVISLTIGRSLPGEAKSLAVFRGHIRPLTTVQISKDSKYVVTGSEDRTARVWDLAGISAFAVAGVELKAEPEVYAGRCPVTIKLAGTITVSGQGGTVRYRFVRSDGATTLPQELIFDSPGSKTVSNNWTLFYRGVSGTKKPIGFDGWQQIEILDQPAPMLSNKAVFKVDCEEPAAQQYTADPVTAAQLAQIMPGADPKNTERYLRFIQEAMAEFGINTPARRAEFLAEVAHETLELSVLEERVSGGVYEGRKDLGNTEPGDGARFKGRGAFMTAGRANYQRFGQQLGIDLIAQPELAATPEVAFRLAALVWQSLGLNELADSSDTAIVRKRLAGGNSGLNRVTMFSDRARKTLGVVDKP